MKIIDKLLIRSQKQAIASFRRTAKNVPFYQKYLKELSIAPDKIKNIPDFKKNVPILDKQKLFALSTSNIKNICLNGNLRNCVFILPSSGYSNTFSFGLNTINDQKSQERSVDQILNYTFDTARKKTLLINSLAMGINIPATNVTVANTGLRSDIVLYIIKVFSKEFSQIIIVGDNSFIKNALEEGIDEGIIWRDYNLRIILGGESFPESFRSYIAHILGIDLDAQDSVLIGSSFGIGEIGLNILFETKETIFLRRRICADEKLKAELFGNETLCPMLFQYHPLKVYIEELNGELIFTNLNLKAKLPLIRYNSKDQGSIIEFKELKNILDKFGVRQPSICNQLPLIALKGRKEYLDFEGNKIYPDLIKHALYTNPALPMLITGYFRIKKSDSQLRLEVQLKKDKQITEELKNKFMDTLQRCVNTQKTLVLFYPYKEFPYGMELDYERKFQYF